MGTLVYFTLGCFLWCCWLDWVHPDTEGREEKETPLEPLYEIEEHASSDELWANRVMVASGLVKPRFKTECLEKDIEHCEIEEYAPNSVSFSVSYIEKE